MSSPTPEPSPHTDGSPEPAAAEATPAESSAPAEATSAESSAADPASDNTDASTAQHTTPAEPSIFDNPPQSPLPAGYYTDDGTPTFDAVRDRIEQRIAAADGHDVLDGNLPRERDFQREQEDLKRAGEERLKQLRKSMGLDT